MSTNDLPHAMDALTLPPPPDSASALVPQLNTVADTWDWLWKDTLLRVTPFALAGVWYLRHSKGEVSSSPRAVAREALVGLAWGVPMAGVAAAFRAWEAPRYRLPTAADQALQTAFYFAVNAPAEEVFWRGMIQSAAVNGMRRIPALRRAAPVLGWTGATAVFGVYHRLGKWSWRSIAGVTVAGGLFGALYEFREPSRRLLAPIIVHGFATAGFLSWGDAYLHQRARRRAAQGR